MIFTPIYEKRTADCFLFGSTVQAAAHPCLNNDAIRSFWQGFCCQSGCIQFTKQAEEFLLSVGEAQKPNLDGYAYAVNIEKTGFCIVGSSEKGLIRGLMTLLQQIRPQQLSENAAVFALPCGKFKENPRLKNQMVHFCIFPETELWEIEKFIRFSAALKYTHIVLEFWGMLQYDCLKELAWKNAFTKAQIRPLIELANTLGMEVIPMFNHWGHASASRSMHGKHVVLDQNPKLQMLFAEDGWTWNIREPAVQNLLRSIRQELTELCGPGEYFHLGCDEAANFPITADSYTVLTDYLNGITEELAADGRRPIIWGDMLITKHPTFDPENHYIASCTDPELEQCLLTHLDPRIVIADWQYGVRKAPVETALVFRDAGFDTLLCPWDRTESPNSVTPCVQTAMQEDLFGILHTTWHTLSRGMPEVARAAFHAWNPSDVAEPLPAFFATGAATLLRKVYPVNGDYEKAGWAKKQISTRT